MDPESLRELGRRFWYAWASAMLVGAAAVVAGTAVVGPENAWLVATFGLLALTYLGLATVSTVQGDHIDATGMAVSAGGIALVGVSASTGFPGTTLWGGFGLAAFGGTIGLWADHGHRLRAALGS